MNTRTKTSEMGRKKSSDAAAEPEGEQPARTKPLILIADDVADNRDIYADYLRYRGYDVLEAKDGFEAVEIARTQRPDIVLMDLSLPGMDGWEATRRIKRDPLTCATKVLAVSGHVLDGTSEGARDAGCDGFLAKPCLPERLEAEVRRMLEAAVPKRKTVRKRSA